MAKREAEYAKKKEEQKKTEEEERQKEILEKRAYNLRKAQL